MEKDAIEARELALKVISEMKEGKRDKGIEFSPEVLSGKVTIKEMIGTADGAREFLEKVTYDVYQGREEVPLLYKNICDTIVDRNFPQFLEANELGPVQVVFAEKIEGQEVLFGSLGPGKKKIVQFHTWAAGVEYSEDMVEYNQTWKVSEIANAFGEAYNKLLNHLHLYPIISATYTTTGSSIADQKEAQESGTTQLVEFDTDLKTTLRNALSVLPLGSVLIANSADQFALEDAIYGSLYSDDKTPSVVRRKLNPDNIVYYDGDEITVGSKTYTYEGVTAGYAYLVYPKKQFIEYVKHDLEIDSENGDLSRLIEKQIVGRTRRAVFAGVGGKYGAIKIQIASS